jgi:hypothetical protein
MQPMISFFLDNWSDVRNSEAMTHVWQQIRAGGHPGFEEGEHFPRSFGTVPNQAV